MTSDFEFLTTHFENKPLIAHKAWELYKGFIYKKGLSHLSRRDRADLDDFASDVYEKLVYFISLIKLEKINPENFCFYLFVNYACCNVLTAYSKRNRLPLIGLEDFENYEIASSRDSYAFCVAELKKKLTPRQLKILKWREEGKTITFIKQALPASYFLVEKELQCIAVQVKEVVF